MNLRYFHIYWILAIPPLFLAPLSVIFPELYLPPIFRVILLLTGTLVLFLTNTSKPIPRNIMFPLFLFALFGSISVLWSTNVEISIERALLNAVVIFSLYVYAKKISVEKQFIIIMWSCALACVLVCVTSVSAYIFNLDAAYEQGNFKGYLSNANSLGQYICSAAFPFILYLFLKSKNLKKIAFLSLLILLTFILIETRSRGAFISAFLSGFVLYLGIVKFNFHNKAAFIFPAIVLIALSYFLDFAFEKYENIETFSTRSYLWKLHMDAIIEKPWLGWGIGINPVDFKLNVDSMYNYMAETEKGSSYYVLPEEVGIPLSGVMYVFFGLFFLKDLPIAFKAFSESEYLQSGLLPVAIVISGLLHGIFESWIFSFGNPMTVIFWMSCIFIASFYKSITSMSNKRVMAVNVSKIDINSW